jgi:hypothetical protein
MSGRVFHLDLLANPAKPNDVPGIIVFIRTRCGPEKHRWLRDD